MNLLAWIMVFCFFGGALSVLAASLFLVIPDRLRTRLIPHLVKTKPALAISRDRRRAADSRALR